MFVLFTGFISVIVSVMWPYSCLFCSMCSAYADLGSLFLVCLMCSLERCVIFLLVCPMYALWHVLHFNWYIPLLL